jgi:RNA polymerase sigma factor (sigma-70 family)
MADLTAYDLYMKNLSKIKRLTNAEQRELHRIAYDGSGEIRAAMAARLQEQALLLVAHVFRRMQARDRLVTVDAFDMDALQEANMAALEALPKWQPVRGTLATWLVPHIKGALLDYANTHTSGGIGSKHNKLIQVAIDEVIAQEEVAEAQDTPGIEEATPITLEESLTYEDTVDVERQKLYDQIREAAWLVRHGRLLTDHYLGGIDIKTLAERYGTSQDTIRRRIDQAIKDLRQAIEVGTEYICGVC